jgi:hypothetical protein
LHIVYQSSILRLEQLTDRSPRFTADNPVARVGKPKEGIMVTTAPPTTVVYHHGQRVRIVDGPLRGRTATVIHHDPDPRAKLPIEARTGRTGTITNLFAVNEVATWTEDDWARTAAEMELDVAHDMDDEGA